MQADVYFLRPEAKFAREKPYGFKFPPQDVRIPRSNMERLTYTCNVADMRSTQQTFNIEQNGFTVFNLGDNLDLSYEDYHDDQKVQPYFRLLEAMLRDHLGARQVKVFRWGFRKRHAQWPIPTVTTYADDQPTTVAHIGKWRSLTIAYATLGEAAREVRLQEREHANTLLARRFQWFNFWKPLKGPLNDWPLLLCDSSTVDKSLDLTSSDLIYTDHAAENVQIYFSSKHQWFYLKDHDINEVLVFKQADSEKTACSGVPHCSAYNPLAPADESPRESIEVRALVYYDD
nr:hypothetical protein B0A51_13882 [Rachicladosporium sp. CCFEE 5018]